ncbi:hypothetical protein [Nonomuraea basaltis]|uniref:hypothetical protein n=1 Tax=Nonomuraea basaltis TaxID=2495887 RepID=UPI00110C417F|nr:hypothetical protein [Nonomuraea basaltis]TMR97522.1 hypothetical protein EJK15_17530 [Nonomuraea basaltis]
MDENLALSLAELRRLLEVGFERTDGQMRLVLHQLKQVEDRHAALVEQVGGLEMRLAEVEKTAVTNAQLTERTRQIIAVVGLLVTVASAVIALIQLTQG